MSSELNNITLNELLQALSSEPSVGQNLKDTCKRLKFQHNAWRAELQNQWNNIDFPELDQADILRMNSTMRKHVASLNLQRKNQRDYYTALGQHAAAALIPPIEDHSLLPRECIIKHDDKCEGWDPTRKEFIIICNHRKPDLEEMPEVVELCNHSKAINLPKTLKNILDLGARSGFTEANYVSLFLQLIKKHLESSYISALTYSQDGVALFTYLLSLVDTSSEVTKIRLALAAIERKQNEPISVSALKVKAMTTSLLFLLQPNAELASIDRRSTRAAQDAIFCLVSEPTRIALTNWKRRTNEMDKKVTLNDVIECVNVTEATPGHQLTRDMKIPERFSQSDVTSSFFTQYNMGAPKGRTQSPRPATSHSSRNSSTGSSRHSSTSSSRLSQPPRADRQSSYGRRGRSPGNHTPRPGSRDSRDKRDGPRPSSRDSRDRRDRPRDGSQGGSGAGARRGRDRRPNDVKYESKSGSGHYKSKQRGEYGNSNGPCKKCSSSGHSSSNCPRYPFFYEQKCSKCAANGRVLYHPPDLCRFFPPTRYLTPEPAKSPVSYKRNENVSSIFQKN